MALRSLFGGIYAGRRVLVTGHTGFKGSWLAYWLVQMGAEVTGLSLDPETTPSHWKAISLSGVDDRRVDLRDANAVAFVLESARPEVVFHLGAQALVRRSYRDPIGTFESNVIGLVNLLEAIRRCPSVRAVINATTDKVYADRATPAGYNETDELGGHDPYSTSKACAELVSDCYRKSFFAPDSSREFSVKLATARAGNVIGGGDWAEDRLVPDLIRAGISRQYLKIRNPQAIRPWQHVLEPLSGYLRLGQTLLEGGDHECAWNFGPADEGELSVAALASLLATWWPALRIEQDGQQHPHEAATLRLSSERARRELGWRPIWNIRTAVEKTAAWYRTFHEQGLINTSSDLRTYTSDARDQGLAWAT